MSLEEKVFVIDKKPKSPIENLAINAYCAKLVGTGKYSLIGRAYYHNPGVILGHNESLTDVDTAKCASLGYEVARRPTGGSAIVVDPKSVLCYSVFFMPKTFGLKEGVTETYRAMSIPLAKELGKGIIVRGTYYLRADIGFDEVPIAGHALKIHSEKKGRVMQFDGVVNRTALDVERISQLLKLRELHTSGGRNYLVVGGKAYDENGNLANNSGLVKIRSEREELERCIGLRELKITDIQFLKALYNVMRSNFGDVELGSIRPNPSDIKKISSQIRRKKGAGKRERLGHCFVDLMDPEPILVYG